MQGLGFGGFFQGLNSPGWSLQNTSILGGPVTIYGSAVNTINYEFDNLQATQVDGAGLWVRNTTDATVGVQVQNSPSFTREARGWTTNSGGASQIVKLTDYVTTITGAANPVGVWQIGWSINGAAYTNILQYRSDGTLQFPPVGDQSNTIYGRIYYNLGDGSLHGIYGGFELPIPLITSIPGTTGHIITAGGYGRISPNLNFNYDGTAMIIGGSVATTSALLDMQSTTLAFIPPRMTQAQRDAIATPSQGMVVFNTDTKTHDAYNGTTWAVIGGGSFYTCDVTIGNAACLTLNSAPVQLVAAPGAGKLISIIGTPLFQFIAGSAGFATNTTLNVEYAGGFLWTSHSAAFSGINTTVSQYSWMNQGTGPLASGIANTALQLKMNAGNPTGGTGASMRIVFKYMII